MGIMTEAADEAEVLSRAVEIAGALAGKAGPTMRTIKSRMYADLIELLENSPGTAPQL